MKNIFLVLCSLYIKCLSYPQDTDSAYTVHIDSNTIVYFIPDEVSKLLKKEVEKNKGKIFFELSSIDDEKIKISAFPISGEKDEPWFKMTNRVLFLNKEFYPLVFDYDRMFATSEPGIEILKKSMKEEYFIMERKRTIQHYYYYVIFKKSGGRVVKSGYEGAKKS